MEESTFVSSELVAQLDFMLSNEDLEGIKNLLQTLNSEEKAIFANYCQSNDLQKLQLLASYRAYSKPVL